VWSHAELALEHPLKVKPAQTCGLGKTIQARRRLAGFDQAAGARNGVRVRIAAGGVGPAPPACTKASSLSLGRAVEEDDVLWFGTPCRASGPTIDASSAYGKHESPVASMVARSYRGPPHLVTFCPHDLHLPI